MAYYVNDKEISESVDINYILKYFKNKGETCVRILHAKSFSGGVDKIEDDIIIEELEDKNKYSYQDGHRTVTINRKRGSICINPYFDKSGSFDSDHSLSKDLQEYILDYRTYIRDNKLREIINEIE